MTTGTRKLSQVIISGGGTGGHVFPALAIADEIKKQHPEVKILFIGAKGRMEMEKVPQHGYKIEGLWISGIQRKKVIRNLMLPFKLLSSLSRVRSLLKFHLPQVVIGVGGYASGPLLYLASRRGIPSLIQEQNSYPGVTNKVLAKYAGKICVGYPGMEKYFPAEKIVYTGNPVRQFSAPTQELKEEAYKFFGFDKSKPILMVTGGSLGSGAINAVIFGLLDKFSSAGVQVLWQTGKLYYEAMRKQAEKENHQGLKIVPFFDKMEQAYAIADCVISRAGAITISELALLGKAAILIPSPNVAEDHQTKNAAVLEAADAAILIKESVMQEKLFEAAIALLHDAERRNTLEKNIGRFAKPDAAKDIVAEVEKLLTERNKW
ncbi:MAG: undecaprenyldiphospho-muramoylpentapeptide beta-N-acetylglucosaminyltransferase [Bacteroidota bacterium]|nr:undecaprenyldiphospho-muramoylpentapeptide beta-N-acetylglucosaminyltransferase [Bacteroidota bacterium]